MDNFQVSETSLERIWIHRKVSSTCFGMLNFPKIVYSAWYDIQYLRLWCFLYQAVKCG